MACLAALGRERAGEAERRAIEATGSGPLLGRRYRDLSEGEKQRVLLGRALAGSGMAATVVTRRGDAGWAADESVALAHLVLCQFDIVWRRLAASRLDCLPEADATRPPCNLSAREREIMARLSRGSTNHDIAEALAISLFTVKNHLKRIFRKIGVSNRTQAVARFNQALAGSAHNAGQ